VVNVFVGFVRIVVDRFRFIEDGKFQYIAIHGNSSCSLTIFHHLLVLLLSYNCDWGILSFNKFRRMGSWLCNC